MGLVYGWFLPKKTIETGNWIYIKHKLWWDSCIFSWELTSTSGPSTFFVKAIGQLKIYRITVPGKNIV